MGDGQNRLAGDEDGGNVMYDIQLINIQRNISR
jgi:hypothetical protein